MTAARRGADGADGRPGSSTGPASRVRSAGWAEKVFGEPDRRAPLGGGRVLHAARRGRPGRRLARAHGPLERRAAVLNERAFDAIRYRGPGTDLTVGLLDQARWMSARFETADGIEYVPNMPTEEVFTTPDCRRADGVITASRPLALAGDVVDGLTLTFEHGRIVNVEADHGAELVRAQLETDERARVSRRAGARRRDVARRPDRPHVLRHAVRRERHVPHRLRLCGRRGDRPASPARASTSPRCTPTSWSAARSSRSTGSPTTARRCRSSATTSGSCRSERGAGARPARALRRARRPRRRERPARPARRDQRERRARAARPRGRARRLPRRRALRRRALPRPAHPPRDDRAGARRRRCRGRRRGCSRERARSATRTPR